MIPTSRFHLGFLALGCLSCSSSSSDSDGGLDCDLQASDSGQTLAAPFVPEFPDDLQAFPTLERSSVASANYQPTVVRRGGFTSIQVNVDALGANLFGDAANEPSIAVDPLNPERMAIGWRQFDTVTSNFRQAAWAYTQDGGSTWIFPGVLEANVFRSDPVLDADSSGNFYYDSLTVVSGVQRTDVFRSTDGGMTWAVPVNPGFGGDKEWMVVDRTGGLGDGHVYRMWNVFFGCCGCDTFTRSTDGALTFSTPTAAPGMPIFGTLAIGPASELYAGGIDPLERSRFLVVKSTNAGDAAVTPVFDLALSVDLGGELVIGGGPNPDGLLGQVVVATDLSSGPFAGNVYLLCSIDPPGSDPLDLHIARSSDGGQTWSAPVRINDDPANPGSWQWFGTLSVAPNGRLDAVWNDTRTSGQANLSELFYASSTDGGATWSANVAASPMWDSHRGWPNQNKIGDYYDMESDDSGAHLAWSATFNDEQDVYYLRLTP